MQLVNLVLKNYQSEMLTVGTGSGKDKFFPADRASDSHLDLGPEHTPFNDFHEKSPSFREANQPQAETKV